MDAVRALLNNAFARIQAKPHMRAVNEFTD